MCQGPINIRIPASACSISNVTHSVKLRQKLLRKLWKENIQKCFIAWIILSPRRPTKVLCVRHLLCAQIVHGSLSTAIKFKLKELWNRRVEASSAQKQKVARPPFVRTLKTRSILCSKSLIWPQLSAPRNEWNRLPYLYYMRKCAEAEIHAS